MEHLTDLEVWKRVLGDGNCMFRCLAFYLYKDVSSHSRVRQEVVGYIDEHWEEFNSFVLTENVTKESYCRRLRTDKSMAQN